MYQQLLMKKKWIAFAFIISTFQAIAQYTDIINSNRPSLSETPFSVGSDVLQFETGFFKERHEFKNFYESESFGTNLSIRYGKFLENLEFIADLTYRYDDVKNDIIRLPKSYKAYGISEFTVGAKYLVYKQEYEDKSKEIRSWKRRTSFDWKRVIPSVGVYAGVNTNFVGPDYKDKGMAPKVGVLLHNEFSYRFNLITNFYSTNFLDKDKSNFKYIVTATYVLHQDWSVFGETEGNLNHLSDEFYAGIGLGYLVNQHLQLDVSYRTALNLDLEKPTISAGFSWRLDRHTDSYIDHEAEDNETIEIVREPFWKRIFKKKYKKKEF
jgi:hypothetical protein